METASSHSKELLSSAVQHTASDIHFFPSSTHTDIFFRVNSKRIHHSTLSPQRYQLLLSYFKFISGMDIGETRRPQDGSMQIHIEKEEYSIRLSTLPLDKFESLAIRLLPQRKTPDLKKLLLFPDQLNRLNNWLQNKSGIILLTGATGSGKTTMLYTLLQSLLQHHSFQAITLEDPIEQEMAGLLQVQVNEKAGMNYDAGLRAALRHDPDLLMVGEIRDKETARFSFHAGFTGHLLMSTLHAKDTFGTIHRLMEMGISKTELHQGLIAIASLELITIKQKHHQLTRGLILEILDGELLSKAIEGESPHQYPNFVSFEKLRRKAFAYGFVDSSVFTSPFFQIQKPGS